MISLLSVINFILVLILILVFTLLFLYNKNINNKIINLKNNLKVIEMEKKDEVIDENYRTMYRKQAYDYSLENYFLDDIYKDLPDDKRVNLIETDYFNIFIKCINSIMDNKRNFSNIFSELDKPNALKYKFYIPIVKFAKYSIDYENYLEKTSQQKFSVRVETKYSHFKDDPEYFVILDNGKSCKKKVHILYFITKAMDLYNNYKEEVNNCIFHNICTQPIIQETSEGTNTQCKL